MGSLVKAELDKTPLIRGAKEKIYTSAFPITTKKILIGFPNIQGYYQNIDKMLKYIVKHFPATTTAREFAIIEELYRYGYRRLHDSGAGSLRTWSRDGAAIILRSPPRFQTEHFITYGLTENLWRLDYEDPVFGQREMVGRIEEIHRNEGYLILNSLGVKRRLIFSKIKGAEEYPGRKASRQGTMAYALLSFEFISESQKRFSWEILENDRSETLKAALGISDLILEAKVEEPPKEIEPPVEEAQQEVTSPLEAWSHLLERPVTLKIAQDSHSKDYCFVLDHLSWSADENLVGIGSKGLVLTAAPQAITLEPLEN